MKNIFILPESGIYGIFNMISGKVYIGSSINVVNRIYRHRTLIKTNTHSNYRIVEDSTKYGFNSFIAFGIEYCSKEVLLEREQYWLDLLNGDYNISRDTINNTSSEESKEKISNTLKRKYAEGSIKAPRNEDRWIEVHQYSLNGDYIASYPCIKDAGEASGIRPDTLSESIRLGKRRSGKFQWRTEKLDKIDAIKMSACEVKIYFKNSSVYKEFDSFGDAAKFFKLKNRSAISNAIKIGKYRGGEIGYLI